MTENKTEKLRQVQQELAEAEAAERDRLEKIYGRGNVWSTEELCRDFAVRAFLAPYVVVTRRSDGVKGTLQFQHRPRFYFDFQPDE